MPGLKNINVNRPAIESLRFNRKVIKQIEEHAERAKDMAIMIATASALRTGHYVKSIHVRVEGNIVYLGATDFKAWWVEFGAYGRTPPFIARAPIRKAMVATGIGFAAARKL